MTLSVVVDQAGINVVTGRFRLEVGAPNAYKFAVVTAIERSAVLRGRLAMLNLRIGG